MANVVWSIAPDHYFCHWRHCTLFSLQVEISEIDNTFVCPFQIECIPNKLVKIKRLTDSLFRHNTICSAQNSIIQELQYFCIIHVVILKSFYLITLDIHLGWFHNVSFCSKIPNLLNNMWIVYIYRYMSIKQTFDCLLLKA